MLGCHGLNITSSAYSYADAGRPSSRQASDRMGMFSGNIESTAGSRGSGETKEIDDGLDVAARQGQTNIAHVKHTRSAYDRSVAN